jgi:hypothetical protein
MILRPSPAQHVAKPSLERRGPMPVLVFPA